MTPLVSICIPAYKQASSLTKLLLSINEQTFKGFEVIISDDSQNNELSEVINRPEWDFEIRYFQNSPAKGSPGNWNNAIANAKGSWIKIMHHDDWFSYPYSLQKFVDAIEKNKDQKFFHCGTWIFDVRTNEKHVYKPDKVRNENIESTPANLFYANVIGAPTTTLIHSDVIELYDENLIWLVDIEYYCRLIKKYGLAKIEDALITTSLGQPERLTNSLINNKEVELKEFFYCFEKLSPLFDENNKSLFRKRLLGLLQNYEVKSAKEIRDAGFLGELPNFVHWYFIFSGLNKKLTVKALNRLI